MTGRRATFRLGSISRWVLFWRKVLRLHFRHGWSPWKRWLRSVRLPLRVPKAIRRRCLIFSTRRSRSRRPRPVAGSFAVVGADARSRHRSGGFGPKQFSRYVLDHGADADPSREQWLQSAPWRFAGQRNRLGRGQDRARMPAGAHLARPGPGFAADWRAAEISGRWRRSHPPRILRPGRTSAHRTRQLRRHNSARVMTTAERRAKATAFLKS